MAITLSIDIGGSNIKLGTLNEKGKLITDYKKLPTPQQATPDAVLQIIKELAKDVKYDRISAGFPGYVRNNITYSAPNLGTKYWQNIKFAQLLSKALGCPAKIVNDADMLGLGVIKGKGFEMMITLGTGFGTALYLNGTLLPHLEMGQHPIKKGNTYDEYIGDAAYHKKGKKKWNKHLQFVMETINTTFNYDILYIGGGNAKNINFKLTPNIKLVTNIEGIDGGKKLWDIS